MKRRPPRTNRTEPLFPYPTLVRSGVGADVDRRFAVLGQIAAARVGPDHDGEADRASLQGDLANLLDHLELVFGARIDREADRGTEIGRAHVCTPVTNAQLVFRLLLEKKNTKIHP